MAAPYMVLVMGSLRALRTGSLAAIILVLAFLSFLLVLVLLIVDIVLATRSFPGALWIVALLALLFLAIQWLVAPVIVRWAAGRLTPVTHDSNPWLYTTVDALSRQADIPMPRVWVSGQSSPNAFVFGRTRRSSHLVVTMGLLQRLNQDEIRAVIGHELGHVRHRDVTIMTWVSAIPLLAYVLARLGFEALRGAQGVRGKGAGQGMLIAVLVAILSYAVYLVTQLLVLHLSRTREYYADAYSAAATRDPHLLASALTKISYGLSLARRDSEPSGLRAFYIGDPVRAAQDHEILTERMRRYDIDRDGQIDAYELQKALEWERKDSWRRANELFATHPPTYKRILMLEQIEEEIKRGGLPADIYRYV